ncbi:MAG TPA: hypothetical protein VL098_11170 [Flavipsychrobacter sp.]|nr:hypothetical protein [Flavipsychrobacter sp.]
MKRTIGLICMAFIGWMNMQAQEVVYSDYDKFDIRTGDFSVIGKSGDRTYVYRGSADGFYLDAYDDNMVKKATVLLDFFPQKIYETRFINYPDRILVLYQAIESNRVVQYAALLDTRGRLIKNPLKLADAKTGIFGPNKSYFSSAVSDDKTKILVYGVENKGRTMQFTGVWLDSECAVEGRAHSSFTADNDLENGEGILDDHGDFYLPAYTPAGSKSYADQLWLLVLPKAGTRFQAKEFPVGEKYVANSFVKLDNVNNKIYIAGFYSDKKSGNYDGVLYGTYGIRDSAFTGSKLIAFDEKIRNATGERNKKRAFDNYQTKQIIVKKDGGFVLISEDVTIMYRQNNPGWGGYYSSYYFGPMMTQTIKEYYYNDVFALSYDGNGVNEWNAFIRKSQYSQEDGGIFSSYALINTGGVLGFLFNDFNANRSKIQFATLDAAGKVDMRSLAAGNSNDPDWLPRSAKQIGLREMVVPCLRRKQICFAKITF